MTATTHSGRRGLGQQRGFRATETQNRYLEAIKARGGSISDELSAMLNIYIDLERELTDEGLRRFQAEAHAEGVGLGTLLGRVVKARKK